MRGLIIEGVTGTGKTTLIEGLKRHSASLSRNAFVSEEETTGELLTEVFENRLPGAAYAERLLSVIRRIKSEDPDLVILERFHHSYYALGLEWALWNRWTPCWRS